MHTGGKYWIDPQTALWATTSNGELDLTKNKLARSVEEEVHGARRLYYFQLHAEAPNLRLCLCQDPNTQQVWWKAFTSMCQSAIGKLEIPLKYQVVIYYTNVLKHHFDPRCLPIPISSIPATIHVPSMLLEKTVKCISPQGSLDGIALSQSISDQKVVHSPSVSEQVVSY